MQLPGLLCRKLTLIKPEAVDGNLNMFDENMNVIKENMNAADEYMNAIDENTEAADENMNAITYAGETTPPKAGDKRLVLVNNY